MKNCNLGVLAATILSLSPLANAQTLPDVMAPADDKSLTHVDIGGSKVPNENAALGALALVGVAVLLLASRGGAQPQRPVPQSTRSR